MKKHNSGMALVFDLDGTLVDSRAGLRLSLSIAFQAIGRGTQLKDADIVVGPPIRVIAALLDSSLTEQELAQIERIFRREYDTAGWRQTTPYAGVCETLLTLHDEGFPMFVVTNKPCIPSEKILEQLHLRQYFHEVVTRDGRSPAYGSKAEMLGEVLRRHSLDPHDTVMVGDTVEDEEAAAANRVRFLFAAYGYGSVRAAQSPLAAFPEILTVVAGLQAERRQTASA